jgi:hypothetical protein
MGFCRRCKIEMAGYTWCDECHAIVVEEQKQQTSIGGGRDQAIEDVKVSDAPSREFGWDGLNIEPIALRSDARMTHPMHGCGG